MGGGAEGFGDGFVEAFAFGLALAGGFVLDVMEIAAVAVGIVGGDAFEFGAVEFGFVDAGFAVVDDDQEVWADGRRAMRAPGLIGFDGLSFHEEFSFWKGLGGGRVAEQWSAGLRGRVLPETWTNFALLGRGLAESGEALPLMLRLAAGGSSVVGVSFSVPPISGWTGSCW